MNELAIRGGRKLTTKTTVHFGPHTSDCPVLIAPPGFYDEDLPDAYADMPALEPNPPPRHVDDLADDDISPLTAVPLSAATAATAASAIQSDIGVYDDAATVEVPLNQMSMH
jgi:hypothetical protein